MQSFRFSEFRTAIAIATTLESLAQTLKCPVLLRKSSEEERAKLVRHIGPRIFASLWSGSLQWACTGVNS